MKVLDEVRKKLPLKRAAKKDAVVEKALRQEAEPLSDEDIAEMMPEKPSPHNCPNKASHAKKVYCATCDWHA